LARNFDTFTNIQSRASSNTTTRFVILGSPSHRGGVVAVVKRTRTGMVIRAGRRRPGKVSRSGSTSSAPSAIAFIVGSALRGLGGVIGGSFGEPRALGRR